MARMGRQKFTNKQNMLHKSVLCVWYSFCSCLIYKPAGRKSFCLLEKLPGMSILNVFYDWMHCKHLGADQYVYGSVLWILVYKVLTLSAEENLKNLWDKVVKFYIDQKVPSRYTAMKITMFIKTSDPGPKLRGKAAQVKDFGKPLLHVWQHFSNQHTPHRDKITVLLKATVQQEDLLHQYKYTYALPTGAAYTFKQLVFSMLQLQADLAHSYAIAGVKLFTMTQKSHFLAHLALTCDKVNPSVVWCYKGEDYMHVMRVLTENCVKGNSALQVSHKIAEHYRLALHFELKGL